MRANSPSIWFRLLLAVALLISIFSAARRGIGAWDFQKADPPHVKAAMQFDPDNPEYPARLAWLTHSYSDSADSQNILSLYQRATELSPNNAGYWADLSSAFEWAGQRTQAMQAFNQAFALFPRSPDLDWKLANFCIRQGDITRGLHLLKQVLLSRTVPSRQVFALAQRANPNTTQLIHEMLPNDSTSLLDFLYYQVESTNPAGAAETWRRLLHSNDPFTLKQSFPYIDALIDWRDSSSLLDAWNTLQTRFPDQIPMHTPTGNLITNGDFSRPFLNDGLDWRIPPVDGVTVVRDGSFLDSKGRSLRIDLAASRSPESSILFQIVPVMPNTDYQFSVRLRLKQISSNNQLNFQILDPRDTSKLFVSTGPLAGTIADTEQRLEFRTPSSTSLVVVMLSRAATQAFDGKTVGTAWVQEVSLTGILKPVKTWREPSSRIYLSSGS